MKILNPVLSQKKFRSFKSVFSMLPSPSIGRTVSFLTVLVMTVLVACSTNPVTGKREISLVGKDWDVNVGKQQYMPLRQAQGGDYVVDPGVEKYVNEVGQRLAAVSDWDLPYEFNVINDSTPNAWALPGGKISINRGLLTELKNEAELAAVLGHEVVHAAARHGARGVTRGMGLQALTVGVLIGTSGRVDPNIAQLGAGLGAQLINSKYGRDAERESDRYGMQYMSKAGYDPQGAVGLQETFVKLSQGRNQSQFAQLFASHPASTERVQNNRQIAASLPKGGELGTARYQKAMARMMKTKPAYQKYDQARKAIKDGDKQKATQFIQQAIQLEPREGHFHSFLGDLAREDKKYTAAKRHYDKAISLNDEFFYYYLGRGTVLEKSGQLAAAKADMQRSMNLLPTSAAQAVLGNIARDQRDFATAKKYYQAAAKAGGNAGQDAYGSLLELDLEENPAAYLQADATVNNGVLVLRIKNPTPRPVTRLAVQILNTGNGETSNRPVNGVLQPGKLTQLPTNIRWPVSKINQIQVKVVRASLAR